MGKINPLTTARRDHRILRMVLTLVSCYLLCWMPYGVVALMTTFGGSWLVTPSSSVVPSVLAKFSTVINPVIYIFFNKQVRAVTMMWLMTTSTTMMLPMTMAIFLKVYFGAKMCFDLCHICPSFPDVSWPS